MKKLCLMLTLCLVITCFGQSAMAYVRDDIIEDVMGDWICVNPEEVGLGGREMSISIFHDNGFFILTYHVDEKGKSSDYQEIASGFFSQITASELTLPNGLVLTCASKYTQLLLDDPSFRTTAIFMRSKSLYTAPTEKPGAPDPGKEDGSDTGSAEEGSILGEWVCANSIFFFHAMITANFDRIDLPDMDLEAAGLQVDLTLDFKEDGTFILGEAIYINGLTVEDEEMSMTYALQGNVVVIENTNRDLMTFTGNAIIMKAPYKGEMVDIVFLRRNNIVSKPGRPVTVNPALPGTWLRIDDDQNRVYGYTFREDNTFTYFTYTLDQYGNRTNEQKNDSIYLSDGNLVLAFQLDTMMILSDDCTQLVCHDWYQSTIFVREDKPGETTVPKEKDPAAAGTLLFQYERICLLYGDTVEYTADQKQLVSFYDDGSCTMTQGDIQLDATYQLTGNTGVLCIGSVSDPLLLSLEMTPNGRIMTMDFPDDSGFSTTIVLRYVNR